MKKIMLIVAFVGIGLFASAFNGKAGGKIKAPLKKEVKNLKKQPLIRWQVTVTCGGQSHVACCFGSYTAADSYGDWMIANLCP
jgi:hypothetical protein